jgi:adenylate kinase
MGQYFRSEECLQKFPEVEEYINNGNLVPDDLWFRVIKYFISKFETQNFIFDGFPRTARQAEIIRSEFEDQEFLVFYFKISFKTAIERLTNRGRKDDQEIKTVTKRIGEYFVQLPEVFYSFGKYQIPLFEINAEKSINEISDEVQQKYSDFITSNGR